MKRTFAFLVAILLLVDMTNIASAIVLNEDICPPHNMVYCFCWDCDYQSHTSGSDCYCTVCNTGVFHNWELQPGNVYKCMNCFAWMDGLDIK